MMRYLGGRHKRSKSVLSLAVRAVLRNYNSMVTLGCVKREHQSHYNFGVGMCQATLKQRCAKSLMLICIIFDYSMNLVRACCMVRQVKSLILTGTYQNRLGSLTSAPDIFEIQNIHQIVCVYLWLEIKVHGHSS